MQRSDPHPTIGDSQPNGRASQDARPFAAATPDEPRSAAIGELAIDLDRYEVRLGTLPVELTYTEFRVLWALARREGRVLAADDLARELWDEVPARARRRIAVIISRLRSRLGPSGAEYIRTVHRVGYRLATPG